MIQLTKSELITLKHLYDGEQKKDKPEGISDAQFCTALDSLKIKGMVKAIFGSGHEVVACQIEKSGIAVIDDLKDEEKRILRAVLKEHELTLDQYTLLVNTKQGGKVIPLPNYTSDLFRKLVFNPLYGKMLLMRDPNDQYKTTVIISKNGEQLIEEIEDEVYTRISMNNSKVSDLEYSNLKNQISSLESQLENSGERIQELEQNEKNGRTYHYEKSRGCYDKLKLSLRERIVIELAFYRKMVGNKDADMSLGRKSLIGNKETVTSYLNEMKNTNKKPLSVEEIKHIRFVLSIENIDTSYVLDYLSH